ncbi:uncharacterized protein C8R40DRAFT_1054050 [Lentinula edodes]|uniref:uncharacterized protein n=1 Tax=Lentinula edodes TaxID=5353 RepID=UPI001E8D5BF8|nr:uncharacterized protein C8R40DRAFT_1054050 [Lentinula edodes]KAH7871785.1 hypothetical protein C8R40DRAFT_1054050 [Lentinula edodes]
MTGLVALTVPSATKVLLLLELLPLTAAFSWTFQSAPTQCQNLSISISGGGTPPYSVLIIPSGSTPFTNGTEVRKIISQQFSSNSVSFQLAYPAESQLVAVVSDATGFGTGGTSAEAEVVSSSDSSCIDASKSVVPDWYLNLDPSNQLVQCTATRIWWTESNVSGTPFFFGVIPGGDSFVIPESNVNTTSDTGTGFSWTPNVREGTTMHIVGNDNNGNGTGGSSRLTVGQNLQNDNSCLNNNSPSSTAGTPAGGSYPTDTSGDSSGGSSTTSNTNVGAIVGGVVGGVLGLLALLLTFYFIRRRTRQNRKNNEKPVDLLQSDEGDERPNGPGEPPEYYRPDPFIVPDPTYDESSASASGRPLSASERPTSRSGTPDVASSSTGTKKTGAPRVLRPVNIIQHDDAGPSEVGGKKEEEPETIELPPAYTNIRK